MGAALGGGVRWIEVEGVRDNRQGNVADLRTVTCAEDESVAR